MIIVDKDGKKITTFDMTEQEIRTQIENGNVDWSSICAYQKLSEPFIREFQDKVDWSSISIYQKLSESFIREFKGNVDWVLISKKQKLSESFIRKFKEKVDWYSISAYQKLSESFIREFLLDWAFISQYQKLSEPFIREFQDKVNWSLISRCQKLSEPFIREFEKKVDWSSISRCQKLSESFIREFKEKVDWVLISKNQKLSVPFIREFKDKVDIQNQQKSFQEKTIKQKRSEILSYAKEHNLRFEDGWLYAFRNHDMWNRGAYNHTITYDEFIRYEDWRCDMDSSNENSFGLGIWPSGNTPIRVQENDWGVAVSRNDGKARVFAFEKIYV